MTLKAWRAVKQQVKETEKKKTKKKNKKKKHPYLLMPASLNTVVELKIIPAASHPWR